MVPVQSLFCKKQPCPPINPAVLGCPQLKAFTVIHNYYIRKRDGTTAAERYFEAKPNDLFEFLLKTDDPATVGDILKRVPGESSNREFRKVDPG
ncbi:hypothetical protein DSCO28_24810 [Desulfosarcina ovata subsp. sediminis]|uniref:Uncharacterized protein n=1 Tax=Desulfosarcina ovata subsp. sediminis TaxID=885957 RepID=A0A5K7ZN65_9BACT|nr:hypothetical protein DSCO28_24810 [Desulfosarcina ovata subsp. sediminis]